MAKPDQKAQDAWGSWASNLYDRAYGIPLASSLGDVFESSPKTGGAGAEWVDTALSVPIYEAIARGDDSLSDITQGRIVSRWSEFWATNPKGSGDTTSGVFEISAKEPKVDDKDDAGSKASAGKARDAAKKVRAGENVGEKGGSVRAGPVALAYSWSDEGGGATADAARALSGSTHYDDSSGDACALWATGIRHTLSTGQPNMASALALSPDSRRPDWERRSQTTEGSSLERVPDWSVSTLQAAYASLWQGKGSKDTSEKAIGAGGDGTGAVCGAFAGAIFGADEVKPEWRERINGWPGWKAEDLLKVTGDILERQTEAKRSNKSDS